MRTQTLWAMTAGLVGQDRMIAGAQRRDCRADALDDASALVAQHDGQRHRNVPIADVRVGLADARRDDLDEHFLTCRIVELDLLHGERSRQSLE
jgi:hypothetical protein